MGLQVWLPLTGLDKNNKIPNNGLNRTKPTWSTAPAWSSTGKLGKCAQFNGSTGTAIYVSGSNFNYTDNFSWACWIKQNYTGSSAQYCFTNGRADSGGYGYGLQVSNATNLSVRYGNSIWTVSSPKGEWHHICFVKKGTNIKIYKDGVLSTNTTFSGTTPSYSGGNGLYVGCFGYTGGKIYPFYGFLNDFRIYNHSLSAKEVSEISKGLILHYPLRQVERNTENLVLNSFKRISNSNYCIANYNLSTNLVSGQKYTITMNGTCAAAKTTGFGVWMGGGMTHLGYFGLKAGQTGTKSFTFTMPSTIGGDGLKNRINIYVVNSNQAGTSVINWVKVEAGENLRPSWSPAPADAGTANTIEYDCSGYKYNGTIVAANKPLWDTTSGRHYGSYKFTTSSQYVQMYSPFATSQQVDTMSASIWFKTNTLNGTLPNLFSLGQNNFFRIRLASSTSLFTYMLVGTTAKSQTISTKTLTDNVWHHVVFVFNKGVATVYLDGAAVGSSDFSATATYLTCNSTSWCLAGYSTTSEKYIGSLSDFRLYTTVLTADDVKELYHTAATVDNEGKFSAYEIREDLMQYSPRLEKTGVQHVGTLVEKDSTFRIYKSKEYDSNFIYEI